MSKVPRALELTGKRFGWLTVISRVDNKGAHTAWKCICDCGNETICLGINLKKGNTKSCGCLKKTHNLKHGHCIKGKTSKIYAVWANMISRCTNKNDKAYSYYGGRGIKVCDRWHKSFENFLEDMMSTYQEGLTLERINVDGNYEPDNCNWITREAQMHNRRLFETNKTGYNGVSITKHGKYRAQISVKGKGKQLGNFDTLKQAIEARTLAERCFWEQNSI